MIYTRIVVYLIGNLIFTLGISMTIKMQYLGLHPWDVLNVGLFDKFGLTIGSWNVIVAVILIVIALILDRTYVKVGTVLNAILVGLFVDIYLWLDILPIASHAWTDIVIIVVGIALKGVGGGIYNAAGIGSGPRDGFMLSISDKTGITIDKVRISIETGVLLLGLMIGGPVFIFTFIFTFIQSPVFRYVYLKTTGQMDKFEEKIKEQQTSA